MSPQDQSEWAMNKLNTKLYLIFIAAFLVMHFTGYMLMQLPYILNAAVVYIAVFTAVMVLSKWLYGKNLKSTIHDTGFHKTKMSGLVPGIFVSAALLCMYPILGNLLNTEIRLADSWQWNAIGLTLTAGFAEEMIFRGFLFGQLRRQTSFKKAVIISAIIFTIAHLLLFTYMSWPIALLSTILAIGLSVPFAYLFEHGGNTIWSPALVHTTIRTIGLVFTTHDENYLTLASAWIITSLLIPYLVLLFYKSFRNIWYFNTNKR